MGTFTASLKTLGDQRGLPATVNLVDDTLSIIAGNQPIGSWSLEEITLEPTAGGYRMGAEGEQILIEMPEKEAFAHELSQRTARGRVRFGRKEKTPTKVRRSEARAVIAPERPHTPPSYDVPASPPPRPAVSLGPSRVEPARPKEPRPTRESIMSRVDAALSAAERRWGSLLPNWLFTRLMLFVVIGAFLLMLAFPGAVSAFLLAAGMLMVIVGAVVYTDSMLASKWLPGRMTPTHVLLFGVAVLMFGVLLGVIAR
jgi:hypothetical protein